MMAAMFPFALILLLLGGGNSLLDQVDSGAFWAAEGGIIALPENFRHILLPQAAEAPPDVQAVIRRLGADSFQEREAASKTLREMGGGVEPALRQAANDPDPEIAQRIAELLRVLEPAKKPSPLRRLMAVKGLADAAEPADAELFTRLIKDTDKDVAREATRGLRRLQGDAAPQTPALPAAERFLPAETANLVELTLNPFPKEGPPNRVRPLHHAALPLLETLGNFRVDRLTLATSAVMDPQEGWALFVVDGEYDPARFAQWLQRDSRAGKESRGGLDVLSIKDEVIFIPVNARRLLVMMAGNQKAMPLDALLETLRNPPAESKLPEALAALRKDSPKDAELKLFVTAPKTLPIPLEEFQGLKSFRIFGARKEQGLLLHGNGEPADLQALTTLIASRKQSLQEIRPMIQQNADGMNAKPMLDMIDSLRMAVSETAYTMELLIPANVYEVIVPLMGFQHRIHHDIEDMNMPEHIENFEF